MFILASASASRQHILRSLGYNFSVQASDIEEFFDAKKSAAENAMELAKQKAIAVSKINTTSLPIIGVDTIQIDPYGKWLEKPRDKNEAQQMMQNRSGKIETLISGIALIINDEIFTGYEETKLFWKNMSMQEIDHILLSGEWEGKCGGIALEGASGLMLEKIEGSIANGMGFPLGIFWKWEQKFPTLCSR